MISRRSFMKSAAISTAAFAAINPPSAGAGEFTGRIKKALKYGMIRGSLTVYQKMALLKKLGFDGVEPGVGDKVDPAELKEAAAAADIAIHGVVNGSVDNIPRAIDRAVFYGASSVLLVAGRVNETMSYERNYRVTQDIIRAAIPYAREKGVLLLVENVWNNFLLSPLEMARYIDELENDFVGVYFDIGNVVRMGWPEHWIRILGPRIKKLDVKEYSRDKQNDEGLWKGFDAKIGAGSVDWAAVRAELKVLNYRGWATAEVSGGEEARLADISSRMDRVLDL